MAIATIRSHNSQKAAHLAVMMPFLMLNRYGDGLPEALFGFKSSRETFEAIGS